jgi:methionyl-tRNA formyltransferase
MTICIAGKNNIAVDILQYLREHYSYPLLVICNKTDDGINSWQKSLRFTAKQYQINILRLEDVYSIPDLLFLSLEFDRIIKPELFVSRQLYNVHFSALPKYKGMFTSIMPVLYGEKESGVTLHKIDEGIDTGDIIDQIVFPVEMKDSARTLYDKYIENGVKIVKKNLRNLLLNKVAGKPQPIEYASYFHKDTIDFCNIHINLRKTAWEIHNQIRAFVFREYQLPVIGGYKIYKSEILPFRSNKNETGKIQLTGKHIVEIQSVDYIVHAFIDFEDELFHYAQNGNINGIREIKDYGYDISVKNRSGWDILIVAAYNEHVELVKYLLSLGFTETKNNKGTTALMYAMTAASKSGRTDVLDEIIDIADIKAKDDDGLSVLDYAIKQGNPSIIKYIQFHYDTIS